MKIRFLAGLALLVAAAAVIGMYAYLRPVPVVIVKGYLGGSKVNLMNNPDVKAILRDKYQLEVEFTTLGGLESLKPEMDLADFIWPGTELLVEQYKKQHGGRATYSSLLHSPIVMYTWAPVANSLSQAGFITTQADGVYYADMEKFAPALVGHKLMSSGGQPVLVYTSDPTKANAGQIFAAMLAETLAKTEGETLDQVFPAVRDYFRSLGFMPPRTADLFGQCVGRGVGACPIFVGYESLLPDFAYEHQVACDDLKKLQAIYPVPTMWATHPMIAATPGGKALLKALEDPAIQKIAVEKHGFRSILGGMMPNNCILTAQIVDSMPLPNNAEMDSLAAELERQ